MTFDKILDDGRLWAVRYNQNEDNCFDELFGQWYDMQWLKEFFTDNLSDLRSYFHITDVYEAIMETMEDASRLECLMLDISPDANLDILFRHLENNRYSEITLGKEKAKGRGTMSERKHTLTELAKMEMVRNYFIDNGVFDKEGLNDYITHEQGN